MRWFPLVGLVGVIFACGEEADEAADYGVACIETDCLDPDPEDYACVDVVDGANPSQVADVLDARRDPLGVLVLKQPGECPRTYAELLDKLRLEERTNCDIGGRAGLTTHLVSERGRTLDTPDVTRATIFRECGTRPSYSLAFHLEGLDAADPAAPGDDVEVISMDGVTSAYAFYSLRDGLWTYHGSSFELARETPTTRSECGRCHAGGGLLMREVHRPWGPWHGALDLPGAAELVDRFEDLGRLARAVNLEDVVRRGSRRWNLTRAAAAINPDRTEVHDGSTAFLLQPLLCPTGIDLASSSDVPLAGGSPTPMALQPDFFVDPRWQLSETVPISADAYASVVAEVGVRLDGVPGATDTFFPWTYVRRADADVEYVELLVEAGLFDEELVYDLLSVDLTRPVFSEARCGLLRFAPTFAALGGPVSASRLRAGFVAALEAAPVAEGSFEAGLLANLETPGQARPRREEVRSFLEACRARAAQDDGRGFVRDAFEVQAVRRARAREFSEVLDAVGVIADDDLLPGPDLRFDPDSCELGVQ